MPTLDEINGVAVRTPIRMNLDAFAQALNKIDQRDLAAREQMSKINAGLANIKSQLNVADYGWFDDFTNNINDQIKQEASFGNYSNALNKAVELAGTYAQDSGLLARIKANQDYDTLVKEVQARADSGKINQITRDRWIAENPYKFDVLNNKLKTYNAPVDQENFDRIFSNLQALTLSQITRNDITKYVDNEGNLTNEFLTDYSDIININESSEIRTRKALQDNFNTLVKDNPNVKVSLMQDYQDLVWKIKELDKQIEYTTDINEKQLLEDYRNSLKKDITKNSQIMSFEEYFNSRSKSVIDNLVIDNRNTKIDMKSGKTPKTNDNDKLDLDKDLDLNSSGEVDSGTLNAKKDSFSDNGQNDLNAMSNIAGQSNNYQHNTYYNF